MGGKHSKNFKLGPTPPLPPNKENDLNPVVDSNQSYHHHQQQQQQSVAFRSNTDISVAVDNDKAKASKDMSGHVDRSETKPEITIQQPSPKSDEVKVRLSC